MARMDLDDAERRDLALTLARESFPGITPAAAEEMADLVVETHNTDNEYEE
ncbi:MAG: hypothetical protein H6765_11365 [Candidatus Peribacteria bacterium]|nr:MAG: hypothetical protein H6765_11365 [Candidatus Peribacteria bacterium]